MNVAAKKNYKPSRHVSFNIRIISCHTPVPGALMGLHHTASIVQVTGFGTRLRPDFFSFFRFTRGFFDGGAFLLPGLSLRDGSTGGAFLRDAIICSSSSLWYA
jgi:hypothetical protein